MLFRDIDSGAVRKLRIGSYLTIDQCNTVSYSSPLGRLLLGTSTGEEVYGEVRGEERGFEILDIS